jgi:NitT/TauT family transport system ATP-binding protein
LVEQLHSASPPSSQVRGLAVDIERVSHHYDLHGSALAVLDDITFSVAQGESIALVGPSGCGKSTLLRLLAGLEHPAAGRVTADGQVILAPHPDRGLVFQDPTLYPWRTVWNNIALGPEARGLLHQQRNRINEVLQLVGLEAFAQAYPRQLSGGMAQRVALARALVNSPRLLLLDEPLGRLDSLTRMIMQEEFVSLWQRARFTSLLVTHDVEEALLVSQRILVLSPRPARLVADLANDIPFPRHRDDPRIQQFRKEVLGQLGFRS